MDDNTANKKSSYLSNYYFSERKDTAKKQKEHSDIGSLGGEISSEFGFGDLESAKDYIEQTNYTEFDDWEHIADNRTLNEYDDETVTFYSSRKL